jgi:hypothetical protein
MNFVLDKVTRSIKTSLSGSQTLTMALSRVIISKGDSLEQDNGFWTGKTIITSIVVDYLSTNFSKDSNIGVAYLYCNFRQQHQQTLEHFLASLLKQFIREQSSIPNSIKGLYNHHKDKRTRPSYNELSAALQSVTASHTRAFIIIDALDECSATGGCQKTLLSEIFNLQAKFEINIFATSRMSDYITKFFDGASSLKIHATDGDVKTYLNSQMLLQNPDIFDDSVRDMAITGIVEAAEGM